MRVQPVPGLGPTERNPLDFAKPAGLLEQAGIVTLSHPLMSDSMFTLPLDTRARRPALHLTRQSQRRGMCVSVTTLPIAGGSLSVHFKGPASGGVRNGKEFCGEISQSPKVENSSVRDRGQHAG